MEIRKKIERLLILIYSCGLITGFGLGLAWFFKSILIAAILVGIVGVFYMYALAYASNNIEDIDKLLIKLERYRNIKDEEQR